MTLIRNFKHDLSRLEMNIVGYSAKMTTSSNRRENEQMRQSSFKSDFWKWLKALVRHWIALAGCALFTVFQLCYFIWRGDWLPVLSWGILAVSFVGASFATRRDEYRKTIGKERRSILNRVVDLLDPKVTVRGEQRPDEICALIAASHEFGSEEDVVWICKQLNDHGHVDPFWYSRRHV
jgi:hypothetical protein